MKTGRDLGTPGSGGGAPLSRGKNAARWAVLAVFLAACLYIAWKVPYTHDDWDWGLPVGVERLVTAGLNSRYAGTALVLAMTRSQLMKTLLLGAGMFLVPWLAARLTTEDAGERAVWTAAGGAALFSMPMVSWQQTFGWVSAFANFVAGAAVMLGVLLLWQKTFSKKSAHPLPLAGALFVLCLAGQLFAENQTLALTGAGVVTGAYALVSRRGRLPALAGLAGCALGALLMFGNPLYGQLAASGTAVEGVRSLVFEPGQGLGSMAATVAERLFTVVLPGLFEYYPGVCLLVSAGCLWRLTILRTPWFLIIPAGLWMAYYCAQNWLYLNQLHLWGEWTYPWPLLRGPGAAIQLALMAAVLLRRALYVEAHHRMEPFMPVDVRWHICFQSGLILLQALWVALMLCAFRLCSPLQIEEETLIRCALITAVFIVPQLGWMMNGYLHITKTFHIYILDIVAVAGIRMIMADLHASLLFTVFILVPGCVYVLIALYKMIRR